jgi:hypothetical protein
MTDWQSQYLPTDEVRKQGGHTIIIAFALFWLLVALLVVLAVVTWIAPAVIEWLAAMAVHPDCMTALC